MMVTTALQLQPHSEWLARLRTVRLGLGGRGVLGVGLGRSEASAAVSPLLSGLVAYWKLDNDGNDVLAAHHLTGVSTLFAAGKINQASSHDGNTRYWYSDTFQIPAAFSVSVWAKLESVATRYICGQLQLSAGGGGFNLRLSGGTLRFAFFNSSGSFIGELGYVSPPLSTWFHVVIWWTGTVAGFAYNNGTPSTYSTSALGRATRPFVLGVRADNLSGFLWHGAIDEVGYWNRALTADERSSLYNAGAGKSHPFT